MIELVNAVSHETRHHIPDRQIEHAIHPALDDFAEFTVDSTAVAANSAWPTEVNLIATNLRRAWRLGSQLDRFGIEPFRPGWIEKWLAKLQGTKVAVLTARKNLRNRQKRKRFRRFAKAAEKLLNRFSAEMDERDEAIRKTVPPPTRQRQLPSWRRILDKALGEACSLLEYWTDKVLRRKSKEECEEAKQRRRRGESDRDPHEEIYSLCDGGAAFIEKGDRQPTFGYKAQFGKSSRGFVTAVLLPEGNAPDSKQLQPLCEQHRKRTGCNPLLVSADDGYANAKAERRIVRAADDTAIVSISGAKGRRQAGDDVYYSELMCHARCIRSGIESVIGHFKNSFSLRRFHRRGIDNCRDELLETVIACNAWRTAFETRRQHADDLSPPKVA